MQVNIYTLNGMDCIWHGEGVISFYHAGQNNLLDFKDGKGKIQMTPWMIAQWWC